MVVVVVGVVVVVACSAKDISCVSPFARSNS